MGIFKEVRYKKDKNGNWKKTKTQIVKAPHDLGRWQRSVDLDNQTGGRYSTVLEADITRSGLSKKVTHIVSSFGSNEKVEYHLITTAGKLSTKAKEKYKGIKGVDNPIKR